MNNKDIELLEKNGWTVECESPFEISDEDGNFASGRAAEIVLSSLKPKYKPKTKCHCGKPIDISNPDCVEFSLCKNHAMDS